MNDHLDRFTDIIIIIAILIVVGLKIGGVITIPWIWLLCPIWGLFLIGLVFAVIITIACLISEYIRTKKEKKNERY